jgi:hypothetical protein
MRGMTGRRKRPKNQSSLFCNHGPPVLHGDAHSGLGLHRLESRSNRWIANSGLALVGLCEGRPGKRGDKNRRQRDLCEHHATFSAIGFGS